MISLKLSNFIHTANFIFYITYFFKMMQLIKEFEIVKCQIYFINLLQMIAV
jgi:hypothetical protein